MVTCQYVCVKLGVDLKLFCVLELDTHAKSNLALHLMVTFGELFELVVSVSKSQSSEIDWDLHVLLVSCFCKLMRNTASLFCI
jgi:hypothetical protein